MSSFGSAAPPSIDPDLAVAFRFPNSVFSYSEKDVAVYALGVGACAGDSVDEKELKYVYHQDGQRYVQVLPTFGATFPFFNKHSLQDVPGLHFDPRLLLHGQQYMEIYKPLPSNACIKNEVVLAGLHDKGKAAILEIETRSYDKDSGELLCMNRMTTYLRGAGGFSKSEKPYSYVNYPTNQVSSLEIPDGKPSFLYEERTHQSQALLYRLSGDYNPLHSDPVFASVAGFSRPILHGLCTYGFAVRAVIKTCCDGNPNWVKSIFGRFLLHVYPGETLITEIWLQGPTKIIYRTSVKERNKAVLSGYITIRHIAASL